MTVCLRCKHFFRSPAIGYRSVQHRPSAKWPICARPLYATWRTLPAPDDPEEGVLPAPPTVFSIVTAPPYARITTDPTCILSSTFTWRKDTLSHISETEVY